MAVCLVTAGMVRNFRAVVTDMLEEAAPGLSAEKIDRDAIRISARVLALT